MRSPGTTTSNAASSGGARPRHVRRATAAARAQKAICRPSSTETKCAIHSPNDGEGSHTSSAAATTITDKRNPVTRRSLEK